MADLQGSHSLEIDAPIQVCFDIAADVENAPEWQGAMQSATAVEHDDEGRPVLVDTQLDSGVTKNRLLLRFSYDEPDGMTWTRESGDLKSLEGSWTFEDLDDDRTRATYALEIGLPRALSMLSKTIKGPAEQKVRELLTHRPVEGLKRKAEA